MKNLTMLSWPSTLPSGCALVTVNEAWRPRQYRAQSHLRAFAPVDLVALASPRTAKRSIQDRKISGMGGVPPRGRPV